MRSLALLAVLLLGAPALRGQDIPPGPDKLKYPPLKFEVPDGTPLSKESGTRFSRSVWHLSAVIEAIRDAHGRGQPVLVGTASVESSELLSRMLKLQKIPHTVLNAKFHMQEAEIVARALHIKRAVARCHANRAQSYCLHDLGGILSGW